MKKSQKIKKRAEKETENQVKKLGLIKSTFWFFIGIFLGIFFLISFSFIYSEKKYQNLIYPGVFIAGVDFGGKSQEYTKNYFREKNQEISETKFIFKDKDDIVSISAKDIDLGYNEELLSQQAYLLGRSGDFFSNINLILQAYLNGINLSTSFKYSEEKLIKSLSQIIEKNNIAPTNALFNFQNKRVTAFKPSKDGQKVDLESIKKDINSNIQTIFLSKSPSTININIKIQTIKPEITTDKVNSLGIKELVASGTSLFQHSIPNRIFNVTLASARLNGILISPNEIFSFNNSIGDISSFTGYKQAYVIQNGRTVLGDGGGVCQVSTTLFRAALNAGLPIVERTAHAYRVGYYEQDSGPGLDATVYGPTVDLKFKNDTGNYLLIQTEIDPNEQRLTFYLYGTKDGRESVVSKPVITSQTPPLPTVYQDDPTLPKGVVKQVDYEAWGANVYFTRVVKKNGKTTINDKFVSNYRPWQAVFLRGTKE